MDLNVNNNQTQPNLNNTPEQPPQGEGSSQSLKSKILSKKLLIIGGLVLLVVIAMVVYLASTFTQDRDENVVGTIGEAQITENDLEEQNRRLEAFNGAQYSDDEQQRLTELRLRVLDFAEANNITVTNEEIKQRKAELTEERGEEAIQKDLGGYVWSERDWTEVLRWQILREKIIAYAEPTRFGEVLSIRWDIFVSELNEQVAEQRRPVAQEYLENVRQQLVSGEISDLNEVAQDFDIREVPLFEGNENSYGLQYRGYNEEAGEYEEFVLDEETANYDTLISVNPPGVSETVCTMGGCQIYNITSGSNGTGETSEIVDILLSGELQF